MLTYNITIETTQIIRIMLYLVAKLQSHTIPSNFVLAKSRRQTVPCRPGITLESRCYVIREFFYKRNEI